MTLQAAAYAAQVLAAVSAVLLARRLPPHRPAAVALVLLATVSILDAPIHEVLPPRVDPWEGWYRVLVYLDGAINLATSATMAGLCIVVAVSPERRRRAVAIVGAVWLLASVVLGALYPSPMVRGAGLQRVYFAVDLFALFVATVALIVEGRADIVAKRSPSSASVVATTLAAADALVLLGPFSPWRDVVFGDFGVTQLIIVGFFVVIAASQGVYLWFIW